MFWSASSPESVTLNLFQGPLRDLAGEMLSHRPAQPNKLRAKVAERQRAAFHKHSAYAPGSLNLATGTAQAGEAEALFNRGGAVNNRLFRCCQRSLDLAGISTDKTRLSPSPRLPLS